MGEGMGVGGKGGRAASVEIGSLGPRTVEWRRKRPGEEQLMGRVAGTRSDVERGGGEEREGKLG